MMRINPKIDLVFKKLFGSEENKDILMSLINAVLPEDQQISELTLKNPYNVSDYAEGKLSILDIKAEDEAGNLYDIEMQLKGNIFYGRRTLYYWAKIFGSQLDYSRITEEEIAKKEQKGRSYSDLNKCIVISLMDFSFFKDERYLRCFVLKDRETSETHQDLDYLDLYFVELEKFEKKHQTVKTTLERWIKFLNNADFYSRDYLPADLAEIEAIKKAREKLDIMYLNDKERQYYESQQKRYLDEVSRIREGIDKGIQEAVDRALQEAEQAKQEALDKALQEAEQAKQEAVRKIQQEAEQAKLEALNKAQQEAEQAKLEALNKAQQEAEQAKLEALNKAQQEAEQAKLEALNKAQQEAEQAKLEALNKAQQEAEQAKQEALNKVQQEAEQAKLEAIAKAKEEERLTKQLEIAKNLIKLGLDNASIAQATSLSEAQIQALRH